MLSKRLQAICNLVDKNKSVIDIGTDHAYIPIYLYENGITNNICASDISRKVIEYAKKNIIAHHLEDKIKVVVSDGFKNICDIYDIAIIAGMGTHTILDIINTNKLPNTLIVSSHNDQYTLRKSICSLGYLIEREIVVKENNKYYVIIKFTNGISNLDEDALLFGISKNIDYYNYLKDEYSKLFELSKDTMYLDYKNRLNNFIEKMLD